MYDDQFAEKEYEINGSTRGDKALGFSIIIGLLLFLGCSVYALLVFKWNWAVVGFVTFAVFTCVGCSMKVMLDGGRQKK